MFVIDLSDEMNVKLLGRILRRSECALLEVVTADESKFLIDFLRLNQMWRIEEVNSNGYVAVDYHAHLSKCVKRIGKDIERFVIRRRSVDEENICE